MGRGIQKVIALEPENAQAHAWYGSLLTIKGRNHDEKIEEIDITVRMVRASTSIALPHIFGQAKVAIDGFEYLLSMQGHSPELLAQIHLGVGNAYENNGNKKKAREHWQQVIDTAPQSLEAEQARALLVMALFSSVRHAHAAL